MSDPFVTVGTEQEQAAQQIAHLVAENVRLRALVEAGYREGADDANSEPYWEPFDHAKHWNDSDTKQQLEAKP